MCSGKRMGTIAEDMCVPTEWVVGRCEQADGRQSWKRHFDQSALIDHVQKAAASAHAGGCVEFVGAKVAIHKSNRRLHALAPVVHLP